MRLGLVAMVALVVGACTRPNDAYEGGDEPTNGSQPTSDSADPSDGPGPGPGTGGSSEGESADVTSVGSIDGGDTTTAETAETASCMHQAFELTPIADTFVISAEGSMCGGLAAPCGQVNFGHTEEGPIEHFEGGTFRAYLLMSFDLSTIPEPQTSYNTSLEVTVNNPAPVVANATQVYPESWGEGVDTGTRFAVAGEATWQWSSSPDPWFLPGDMGSFELALLLGNELVTANGAAGVTHPIFFYIPDEKVDGWFAGENIIHIAVTVTETEGEAGALSRESASPPILRFEEC